MFFGIFSEKYFFGFSVTVGPWPASYCYMYTGADDNALIQEALKGHQPAYATLVARYQNYVFTLCLRYVNNRELAEELAQDVFVKAYRCLADFRAQSKFSTWLYTIVHTTCLSQLRKKQGGHVLLDEERMIAISDAHNTGRPGDDLNKKATKQALEQAMKELPPDDAALLSLYYQAEQSVEEIGNVLGMTASNVKVRLFRARGKLKEIIERKYLAELR